MKIDLLKDRGILTSSHFIVKSGESPELSEDEILVESLKKRHASEHIESEIPDEEFLVGKNDEEISSSNRNPLREFLLLIILLSVTAYYLYDKGVLIPYVDTAKSYILDISGMGNASDVTSMNLETELTGEVLSDDIFNQLMPVTADIEALADSIALIEPESLYVAEVSDSNSTMIIDTTSEYLPVAQGSIHLSDDDIQIINNRSLLLMLSDIIENVPEDIGKSHLYIKRDAMTFNAIQGGDWVKGFKATLDKFVLGSFNENYSSGKAEITSKFEIIMNAEQGFQVQILDEMRLLDVLAHPFNEYLQQIIVDLSRGVNDNPAKFTFSGTPQEIQYILASWAETRTNFLIRSIELEFMSNDIQLTFDVIFFNYTP